MIRIGDTRFRIYPMFRSASANWVPMPPIRISEIPFLDGRRYKGLISAEGLLPTLATYPKFGEAKVDPTSMDVVVGPIWEDGQEPVAFPYDSLRIDVLPLPGSEPGSVNPMTVVRRLLGHVRCLTGQWWITRATDVLSGWTRNEVSIDKYGALQGDFVLRGSGRTAGGEERPVVSAIWAKAVRDTEAGVDPPIADQLLLDADYYLASYDLRRCILDAATACEVQRDQTFRKIWDSKLTSKYRKGRLIGNDITAHLSHQLAKHCGRSLAIEQPALFENLKELWLARGNVAHGRSPSFVRNGVREEITDETAKLKIMSAHRCIMWMRSL